MSVKPYPLEKFIAGIVSRLMRSYKIDEHLREDLIQEGHLAALQCQNSHPKESKNRAYLQRAVVNALLKAEQGDRPRRNKTVEMSNTIENIPEREHGKNELLVKDLIDKTLTPSEKQVIELAYGIGGYAAIPDVRSISRTMGKPESWVKSRLTAAMAKLRLS